MILIGGRNPDFCKSKNQMFKKLFLINILKKGFRKYPRNQEPRGFHSLQGQKYSG
jgi:hypothetical protein